MDEVGREAEEWLGAFARAAKKLGSEPAPAEARGLLRVLEVVANSMQRARTIEDRRVSRTEARSSELLALMAA